MFIYLYQYFYEVEASGSFLPDHESPRGPEIFFVKRNPNCP